MSTTSLSLKDYQFRTRQDILTFVNQPDASEEISEREERYYKLNVAAAIESLTPVGKLFQKFNAENKRFNCNSNVVAILSNYQGFIRDSRLAIEAFIKACLKSIRHHQKAVTFTNKDKFEAALKALSKCSEQAEKMADVSDKLAKQLMSLIDPTKKEIKNLILEGIKKKKEFRIFFKIGAAFQFSHLIWENVTDLCKQLIDTSVFIKFAAFTEEFKKKFIDSEWNWLTLFKISIVASESIEQINKDIDVIMINFLIQEISNSVIAQIKDVNDNNSE